MIHVTCRLTAKNRDQLRNPTLGSRVWATFTFFAGFANSDGSEVHLTLSQQLRWSALLWTTATPLSLYGACKSTTDKLQRVLNAAARVVNDTGKYDRRLGHLLHDELHWLDVPQRVQYKLCATVHRCMQYKARTAVHDGLLHPHLRHCSSPASAVRRLPSAVRTATPAFHVRSSGLFCGGLELVISDYLRDPSRSFHHLTVFAGTRKLLFSRSTSVHSGLEALRLCTIYTKCIPILVYGSEASPLLKS